MNILCVGFNYLDSNSIDYDQIQTKNDKYLGKLDWKLLAKSFSYHYVCVNISTYDNLNCKLRCLGYSKLNIPYIFTYSDTNIYGLKFHPEIIAIKQFFWNKKIVFCIGGCETNFWIFPEILFYDYTNGCIKNVLDNDALDKKVTNDIFKEQIKLDLDKFNSDIYMHFFDVFINL